MEKLNLTYPDHQERRPEGDRLQLPPEYVDEDFHQQTIGRLEVNFSAEAGLGLTVIAETQDGKKVKTLISPRELLALVQYVTDNKELLGPGAFKNGEPYPEPTDAPVVILTGKPQPIPWNGNALGPEPVPTNRSALDQGTNNYGEQNHNSEDWGDGEANE